MVEAIKYCHFIKTDITDSIRAWLAENTRGQYKHDKGAWRDYVAVAERGIEFELKEDADAFLKQFERTYSLRHIKD